MRDPTQAPCPPDRPTSSYMSIGDDNTEANAEAMNEAIDAAVRVEGERDAARAEAHHLQGIVDAEGEDARYERIASYSLSRDEMDASDLSMEYDEGQRKNLVHRHAGNFHGSTTDPVGDEAAALWRTVAQEVAPQCAEEEPSNKKQKAR